MFVLCAKSLSILKNCRYFKMTDYSVARKNMVECQLHPCGVNDERVLTAYKNTPRERFVSQMQRSIAYADNELPLGHERFLISPMVHARMVHATKVKPDDVVLDIGGATGYSAAVLSQLATTVVAVENQADFLEQAKATLIDMDLLNILHVDNALNEGDAKHGPYDVIIINGAAEVIPEALLDQLNVGGRLCYIERRISAKSYGQVVLLTKRADNQCDKRVLFETNGHVLSGFAAEESFSF